MISILAEFSRRTILSIVCLTIIIVGPASSADQGFASQWKADVAAYLPKVKYIMISLSWPSRNSYYVYGGSYDYMKIRRQRDFESRFTNEQLNYYGFFNGKGNIERKLFDRFKANAGVELLNGVPIILSGDEENNKKYYPIDADSVLLVSFVLGQQKATLNEHEVLIGAVFAEINPVGSEYGAHFRELDTRFRPEPFLIDSQELSYNSLDQSLDYISLQVAEYLKFIDYQYQVTKNR